MLLLDVSHQLTILLLFLQVYGTLLLPLPFLKDLLLLCELSVFFFGDPFFLFVSFGTSNASYSLVRDLEFVLKVVFARAVLYIEYFWLVLANSCHRDLEHFRKG